MSAPPAALRTRLFPPSYSSPFFLAGPQTRVLRARRPPRRARCDAFRPDLRRAFVSWTCGSMWGRARGSPARSRDRIAPFDVSMGDPSWALPQRGRGSTAPSWAVGHARDSRPRAPGSGRSMRRVPPTRIVGRRERASGDPTRARRRRSSARATRAPRSRSNLPRRPPCETVFFALCARHRLAARAAPAPNRSLTFPHPPRPPSFRSSTARSSCLSRACWSSRRR